MRGSYSTHALPPLPPSTVKRANTGKGRGRPGERGRKQGKTGKKGKAKSRYGRVERRVKCVGMDRRQREEVRKGWEIAGKDRQRGRGKDRRGEEEYMM